MNQTVIAVLATAVALFALNYLKTFIDKERQRRAAFLDAQVNLTTAIKIFNDLAPGFADAVKSMSEVPKYVEGLVKVCEALVVEVSKNRQIVSKFSALIMAGQDPKDSIQNPTDTDKDMAYRTRELVAQGVPLDTAMQQIADEELKKTMYASDL